MEVIFIRKLKEFWTGKVKWNFFHKMKINQESREKILSDYERVNNVLFNILSSKLPNYIAEKDKYFLNQPLLEREAVLLTDDKGLFKYLKQTRDCLEELLIYGNSLRFPTLSEDVPDYIKNLKSYMEWKKSEQIE